MTDELRRLEWIVLVYGLTSLVCLVALAEATGGLRDRVSRLERVSPNLPRSLRPSAPAGARGLLRCDHGESSIVARVVDGKLRVSEPKTTGCIP